MTNRRKIKIQILIDNPASWIMSFMKNFVDELQGMFDTVQMVHKHEEVEQGDVLILLACEKKFNDLSKNKFNLVVHESDLPQGKGWSPLTWQVLEGRKQIPVCLFEATEEIDAGDIYEKETILLQGTELVQDLRKLQFAATRKLIFNFLEKYPHNKGQKQSGPSSLYPRRRPQDSTLDIDKPLRTQFPLLQVADNEKYPAFFVHQGQKYILKIYKDSAE